MLRALANFKAGDCDEWSRYPGVSHSRKFKALMHPGKSISPGEPLPMQMLAGNVLAKDVKVGQIITTDMVIEPRDSVLWSLRRSRKNISSRIVNNAPFCHLLFSGSACQGLSD